MEYKSRRKELFKEMRSVCHTVRKFDNDLLKSFDSYFSISLLLSNFAVSGVEDERLLEAEILGHHSNFQRFCSVYSKFRKLIKHSLVPKINGENGTEIVYNYNDHNTTFVNYVQLKEFLEKIETNDTVFDCLAISEDTEDYTKMLADINQLSQILNKDPIFIDEDKLRRIVQEVKEKIKSLKLSYHARTMQSWYTPLLKGNLARYYSKYYGKYIMKRYEKFQDNTAKYNGGSCAICLEEFKGEKSVTKLKCSHIFCSNCISKWFYNSLSCPCCRDKLELDVISRRFDGLITF